MAIEDVSEIKAVVAVERGLGAGGTRVEMGYEILHGAVVLEGGSFGATVEVDTPVYWERARARLMGRVEEVLVRTRTRQRGRVALGGRSIADVAPWLDGWRVREASGERRFTLHHAVDDGESHLFIFNEGQIGEDGLPTDLALLEKLVGKCLVGPSWCSAVPGGAGEVTLGCEVVAGAVEYRWYGRVPWARWPGEVWAEWANGAGPEVELVGVEAGEYEVRALALGGDGVLGLMGEGVRVAVE